MGWIQRKSQKSDVDCWGCPKSDPDYSQTECTSQFFSSSEGVVVGGGGKHAVAHMQTMLMSVEVQSVELEHVPPSSRLPCSSFLKSVWEMDVDNGYKKCEYKVIEPWFVD